jgi:hypothetical protein
VLEKVRYLSIAAVSIPPFTSNTAGTPWADSDAFNSGGWTASASSSLNSAYLAWEAFNFTNVDRYDCWIGENTDTDPFPQWLSIEFPAAVRILNYKSRLVRRFSTHVINDT